MPPAVYLNVYMRVCMRTRGVCGAVCVSSTNKTVFRLRLVSPIFFVYFGSKTRKISTQFSLVFFIRTKTKRKLSAKR